MGRWTLHPGLELTVAPCRKNLCPSPANPDRASLQIRVGEGAGGGMGGGRERKPLSMQQPQGLGRVLQGGEASCGIYGRTGWRGRLPNAT